jgi:hypothetical protein
MNNQLNDDDVVLMTSCDSFGKTEVCQFVNVKAELQAHLKALPLLVQYINRGIVCQVLRTTGGGWQKGKMQIRLELEFIPDEPPPQPRASDIVLSPNSQP